MDPRLQSLKVWPRLEIGPVLLEPRRLRMPYRIGDASEELIYRYDEDVFDPDSAADARLAALIGAQVALNYGLFAEEIVLHGSFAASDRRFLRSMAANTAREIYVNKLRAPNPLLVADVEIPEVDASASFAAKLVFPDARPADGGDPWSNDANKVLVLSSGGKDSLLSLGLLEELGYQAHPVFVNESGRHWFSAVNAWRTLEPTRAHAARVWTNCDRVFNWALRQLPIVRPDYARIRADIYPIRLWTVAVFAFGVLPLMRSRGIGRMVIGDEYDTTVRARHRGIPHYAGLFDQSRWFDDALTRFFHQTGYGITQFSLLRSASELIIEKVLVERYPELLAMQMSCHAASIVEGRARPCGRCEKCRRIVGMLTALGADPARCGYEPDTASTCLTALANSSVKQLAEDAAHLAFLLVRRGDIPADSPFGRLAAEHPETMMLRIDPTASPTTSLPDDLRQPILGLLSAHADGVVERRGRRWHAVTVAQVARPTPRAPAAAEVLAPQQAPYLFAELSWPQARRRLSETDVALLPVGAIEQHGPHLPLDIDTWDAAYLAQQVAASCSDPKPLVLPTLPYGVSYHHDDFPGTLSIGPETLSRLVREIGMSAARNGIRKLVIINGHGGNIPALHFAAQQINRDAHIFTCVDTGESSDAEVAELVETANDVHGGECETSTALATRPHLVFMEHAMRDVPDFQNRYLDFGSKVSLEWYVRTVKISASGVMGDATKATAEKGAAIWAVQIKNLVELVEHLKSTSLDQLHRPGADPD